jgi:hypothetical protein
MKNRERCERLQAPYVCASLLDFLFFLFPFEKCIHVYVFTSLFTVRVQQGKCFFTKIAGWKYSPRGRRYAATNCFMAGGKKTARLEERFTRQGNCRIFIELERGSKKVYKKDDEGEQENKQGKTNKKK